MATYGALAIGAPDCRFYARVTRRSGSSSCCCRHRQWSHLWHSENIPAARPRDAPVLRVVGFEIVAAQVQNVLRGALVLYPKRVYRPLVQQRHWDNTGFCDDAGAFIAVRFSRAKFPDRYGGATVATTLLLVGGPDCSGNVGAPSAERCADWRGDYRLRLFADVPHRWVGVRG